MELTRIVYRCTYVFKDNMGPMGPVRDSRAFRTEEEARIYAAELKASGYGVVVWREFQIKKGRRWETDLHHDMTQPLDP